ncbi:MAG: ABC transporter ATP-binding protein, partial [Clostridia bacterium]|nr:ABC transporter ATP-binding protein [Clostridia bacterium]
MAKTKKTPVRRETWHRLLSYIRRSLPLFVLTILFAGATVVLSLWIPILCGRAIDCMIGPGQVDFDGIADCLVKIGIAAGLVGILQWVMNSLNNRITYRVIADVRRDAFDTLTNLPLSYIDSHPHGGTVSRVIADVDQFADGLLLGFTQFFTGIATILCTLVFMLTIHPLITLVVVVLTPLSLFVASFIAKRTYDMFRLQSDTRSELTAQINEVIGNQPVVRAFSKEADCLDEFDAINDRLEKCSLRAIFFSSITNPSTRFINNIVYAAVALTGAFAVIAGGMTVGGLTSFLAYANQYTKPFNEISGVITELQNALACAERIFSLIDEEREPSDRPDAVDLTGAGGEVTAEHVDFSYTPERELIRDLNLTVEPGERVAIVGPTGCGK